MKKSIIRIALTFATYDKNQLNSFTILVIACLKNNALFPNLPVPIADLTALLAAYQAAMTAAAQGGPKDTAALAEARDALVVALRQIAAYIQSLGLTNVSDVLTSGFDVVVWSHVRAPLDPPVLVGLDNSKSGQLQLKLQAVPNARAYQAQFSADGGKTWQEAGIFSNTRQILIPNLTPGTVYGARVRAIGGSEQYSGWSGSIAIMAT